MPESEETAVQEGGAPVSVADAKAYLRIDHDAEDVLLGQMLEAVLAEAENRTGRSFSGEDAEALPAPVRQWMLIRLSTLYEQRETFAVGSNFTEFGHSFADCLLDPYVVHGGF